MRRPVVVASSSASRPVGWVTAHELAYCVVVHRPAKEQESYSYITHQQWRGILPMLASGVPGGSGEQSSSMFQISNPGGGGGPGRDKGQAIIIAPALLSFHVHDRIGHRTRPPRVHHSTLPDRERFQSRTNLSDALLRGEKRTMQCMNLFLPPEHVIEILKLRTVSIRPNSQVK